MRGKRNDREGTRPEDAGEGTSPASFDALVRPHLEAIHRWALVMSGDPDEADDILQDVLLRLHRHRDRFPDPERRKTWLYRITRNAYLDRLKARRREAGRRERAALEGVAPMSRTGPTPERGALQNEASRLVREFLEGLSERQREVLDLVDLQGYEPIEAARLMGLEPVTARVHLMRARRTLRTWILEQHPEWSPEADHDV